MHKKINFSKFLSLISLRNKIKSLLTKIITSGIIGKTINDMISNHIMMYHDAYQRASNPPKQNIKDLLPPPTPKQIINNINRFISSQNNCFGHASDDNDSTKYLENLTIEELNDFHDKLTSINKSFFDDHDFSIWKVENKAYNDATSMQKELDSRGSIKIKENLNNDEQKDD
jgi:hypothetical protein